MNSFKVDTNEFEYMRFISAEPRFVFSEGVRTEEQAKNSDGIPLYSVSVLVKTLGANKPETLTVKVPSNKPISIQELSNIGFKNLTAFAYAFNNRASIALSADAVGVIKND